MATSSHRVSVVIASNRSAPFLAETVATIQAQSYPVHEIVLVDDGAPTDELQVAAQELGLRYTRHEASGVSIACNRGPATTEIADPRRPRDLLTVVADDDAWHLSGFDDRLRR